MFKTASFGLKLTSILVVIALIAGTGAYVAWNIRSGMAVTEAKDAVTKARSDWDRDLKARDELEARYQARSDQQFSQIMNKIGDIKVTHTTITKNIQGTVEKYPVFYVQPMPQEGYNQWIEARKLLQ